MGDHDDERLAHDLPLLLGRRRLYGAVGAVGAEVYPSVEDATSASNLLRTSQLAFLEDSCRQAYEGEGL